MAEITLRDLEMMATKTPAQIVLSLLGLGNEPDPYAKFVELVERAIDWISQELARNPELKQDISEDELTAQIVSMLKCMSLDASHDTKIGGHCDITIEAREEMLWLGEAKKIQGKENSWLYKGFEQLNTRYSTGGVKQDAGGMIIYCYTPRIDEIIKAWGEHLKEKVENITIQPCTQNPLAIRSEHDHLRTGRRFRIRHTPVSLYFLPKDRELS